MKHTVTVSGKTIETDAATLEALAIELFPGHPDAVNPVVAALVDSKLRELTRPVTDGSVIEFLDLSASAGIRIYERSLCYVMIRAIADVLPGAKLDIQHSIGSGLYCELEHAKALTPAVIAQIEERMREIAAQCAPFEREKTTREEAIEHYNRVGQTDKARLLKFRPLDSFQLYKFLGMRDYFYGYMTPHSGYIQKFALELRMPGFVLIRPSAFDPKAPLESPQIPRLSKVFRESERWADILECGTVADLNEMVESGSLPEFIRINEALHENSIAKIARVISIDKSRVVLIAGPSSSGKTTFAERLMIQLKVLGLKPVSISLDNYYINREMIPIGPDGQRDFEDINTLDLDLLNDHLAMLIAGEQIGMPVFDFHSGERLKEYRPMWLAKDQILVIEGIHGLNDELTRLIPPELKFKVYISALTQLNLDAHNRIQTTDARLLRRMIRDYQYRGSSAERTMGMWPTVRRGENKWIFPFQELSDAMFNSALDYELLFLKPLAKKLLSEIPEGHPLYLEANRLIKFLNYILEQTDVTPIPQTSILREFIGGSCFGH